MILISHRGNRNGKNEDRENSPDYIQEALDEGYNVEIDVWVKDGKFFLGHDEPQYPIEKEFLMMNGLWCHAKNLDALREMLKYSDIHCFWHQEDDFTLTSNGFIFTYPGQTLTDKSICAMPEMVGQVPKKCFGVCSDFVVNYRNKDEH